MLVRSIQNNRTANFLAAATFATPFFMRSALSATSKKEKAKCMSLLSPRLRVIE